MTSPILETMLPAHFDAIKLIWRPEPHTIRRVVGTLCRSGESYSFCYDGADLEVARSLGFRGYPGMGEFDKTYNGQAMSAFSSRLPSRDRTDIDRLLSGWGANSQMDDFETLGLTFGRLPTDMYEFIPVIKPLPGTSFYSDLAGLQNYSESEAFRTLPPGSPLDLVHNAANEFDPHAVQVMHLGNQVAHVKRIHCESVYQAMQAGLKVSCELVRVRPNGIIKEAIVEIAYS